MTAATIARTRANGELLLTFIAKVGAPWWKWAFGLIGSAYGYIAPTETSQKLVIGTLALVILDTATGIVAAWSNGEKVTSQRCRRVVVKLFAYFCLLLVIAILCNQIDGLEAVQGAAIALTLIPIMLTEAVSNVENVRKLGVLVPKPMTMWLKKMLKAANSNQLGTELLPIFEDDKDLVHPPKPGEPGP